MTRQRLALDQSDHHATSFAAARCVLAALVDQPPRLIVTAATLVSEIVGSLTRARPIDAIELETEARAGSIRVTLRTSRKPPDWTWKVDGLARLLLERLTLTWGQDTGSTEVWFELTPALQPA